MKWRFIREFGHDAYCNAFWRQYTSDGVIPFKAFVLAVASIRHYRAEDELIAAHAGTYAQSMAFGGGKDAKTKRYTRNLIRLAHPEDLTDR